MSWLLSFWFLVLAAGFFLNLYFQKISKFWKNCKVPHTQPRFPLGDLQNGGWNKNIGLFFKDLYEAFPAEKFFGIWMFTNPLLLVKDLDLIKTIFVRDFNNFQDRGVYYNKRDDPLSGKLRNMAHLFSIEGIRWRNLRIKLSPTFTTGKMKMMFPLVIECSRDLEEHLKEPANKKETVDMKEVIARFMTDVISLCAFGIHTNSLKNPEAKFREMGKRVLKPNLRSISVMILQFCAPKLAQLLRLRVFPTDVSNYFMEAVRDVMENREKHDITRNDFMQLLMQLKNEGFIKDADNQNSIGTEDKLTLEEAAAEAFVFFLAGFETSSSTAHFALYELAKNPEIQEKLRNEINRCLSKYENVLTYESTRDIPYLDRVIDGQACGFETLRKYPVVPTLQRECNNDYQIPDSDAIIPKGTVVHIPIYAIHMDKNYFPEPEKFDPDRFLEEEKQKRHHYAYLPFGEGPRNCIGKRFGQMQVRVALIVLLRNFRFELSENQKVPIKFDPSNLVLSFKDSINLKISRV